MNDGNSSVRRVSARAFGAVFTLLALVLSTSAAHAQSNTTGYISGDVVAATGPEADASITVRNLDTEYSRTLTSNDSGGFRFSGLPTGRYEVSVSKAGYESRPVTVNVVVGEGARVSMMLFASGAEIEEVVVQGQVVPVDTRLAETATVVTASELERLPVPRDINAVALMAPGAVYGDTIFGSADATRQHYSTGFGLASFGGASVAENAYYINGMNVTNFRNGLGGSTVPYQFYDQFQLKTGGFGAEFGRSIGGVVSTTTRRGGNEWQLGVGMYMTPESLRGHAPDVVDPNNPDEFDSVFSFDEETERELYIYGSGPIIEDRLFLYALYSGRDNETDNYTGGGRLFRDRDDDPFWGVKLDWNISDDHILEYTGFSDQRDSQRTTYAWDEATRTVGAEIGPSTISRGGDNHILKYTGHFTDNFSLFVLAGTSEYDLSTVSPSDEACPLIFDTRGGGTTSLGCWTSQIPEVGADQRDVYRVDAELSLNDRHLFRFGIDHESNASDSARFYSGHIRYMYFDATPGETLNSGGVVPAGVTQVASVRELEGGGAFDVKTSGLYFEDEWYVTDAFTLRLGVRNERFDNRNAAGDTFIKITDQWAPRLGFSWDLGGDSNSKLYGTFGRYHLPIATNTNIRLAGQELFTETWYELVGLNADETGQIGVQIGPTSVFSDGVVPDVREVIDDTIEPMYQDEWIIGYERDLFGGGYIGGVSFTYRDLGSLIEDVTIDAAINQVAFHYILTNPGTDAHTFFDVDGDGVAEELFLTAEELGFPEAERTYLALTFYLEKLLTDRFYAKASYTWSHGYGNVEGYVRSDNGQDDAGLTTLYDFPGLTDGAFGNLPNDRRHQLKLFGNYALTPNLSLTGAYSYYSGRPRNAFGVHPTDQFSALYGAESFYNQGVLVPRGSLGEGPDVHNIDIGLTYQRDAGSGTLTARLDVLNVFDFDDVTEFDEGADEDSGVASPTFGLPLFFQRPREVRVGLQYDFRP